MAHTIEDRVQTSAGLRLFYRGWRPAERPRAVVAIVPGFNSHSGYYGWVGEQLAAAGFAAYAVDLRGRGHSEAERFFVDSIDDYVNDVSAFVDVVRTRESGVPLFMLGHSAGGVVACTFALEKQAMLAGLICESFAYQLPAPDFAIAVLKGLSHLAPHAHVLALKNADFSRDPAVVAAMNTDPLIQHETQPTRTLAALARADERLKQSFPHITLPVLILHGTADKATRPSGSQFFYDTTGSSDKTLKFYDGYYHDTLNDVGRERVLGDILTWLNAHAAA